MLMLSMLCKGTSLRMHLTVGVRSVLRCERLAVDYVGGFLLCLRVRRGGWCLNVRCYVSALVGVIIKDSLYLILVNKWSHKSHPGF